jgi:hypothetical protein
MAKGQQDSSGHQHQAVSGRKVGAGLLHQTHSGAWCGITGC